MCFILTNGYGIIKAILIVGEKNMSFVMCGFCEPPF